MGMTRAEDVRITVPLVDTSSGNRSAVVIQRGCLLPGIQARDD